MQRVEAVRKSRIASPDVTAIRMAERHHQFREMHACINWTIAIPIVSSESRAYLPVTLESRDMVFPNTATTRFLFLSYRQPLVLSRALRVAGATKKRSPTVRSSYYVVNAAPKTMFCQ